MSAQDVTPREQTFVLKSGRKLVLRELTLLDLRDGEKLIGKPADKWADAEGKMDLTATGVVLWLLARKDGVTPDDVAHGRFALGMETLLNDIVIDDMAKLGEAMASFLSRPRGGNSASSSLQPSVSPVATASA